MGENQLLVDTDILIAYLNRRAYRSYLENPNSKIYYSAVTKKELLLVRVEDGLVLGKRGFHRLELTGRRPLGVLRRRQAAEFHQASH